MRSGVGGHYNSSFRVSSSSAPARASSIWRRSSGTSMRRDRVLEERPLEQALRGIAVKSAREQVEQHLLVELAGGGAVAAAHLVGVDLQLRAHVDLRLWSCQQPAQRLLRVGPGGAALATTTLPLKATRARAAAMPRNSCSLRVRGRGVLEQGEQASCTCWRAPSSTAASATAARSPARRTATCGARGGRAQADQVQPVGGILAQASRSGYRRRSCARTAPAGGSAGSARRGRGSPGRRVHEAAAAAALRCRSISSQLADSRQAPAARAGRSRRCCASALARKMSSRRAGEALRVDADQRPIGGEGLVEQCKALIRAGGDGRRRRAATADSGVNSPAAGAAESAGAKRPSTNT